MKEVPKELLAITLAVLTMICVICFILATLSSCTSRSAQSAAKAKVYKTQFQGGLTGKVGGLNIDLPEEISLATEDDNLVATKTGDTLLVYFQAPDYEDRDDLWYYDGEGNRIPDRIVRLLVTSQFVKTTHAEQDSLRKYFYFRQ